MPSKARTAFDENVEDINKLMEFHKTEGGDQRGRRYGLEVLNSTSPMDNS